MDPHQRTRRFPTIHGVTLGKPRSRATVMRFARQIVIYPSIWGRQPTAEVLLALVTYEVISAICPEMAISRSYERSDLFTLTASSCIRTSGEI
jgi:hypothetical protein